MTQEGYCNNGHCWVWEEDKEVKEYKEGRRMAWKKDGLPLICARCHDILYSSAPFNVFNILVFPLGILWWISIAVYWSYLVDTGALEIIPDVVLGLTMLYFWAWYTRLRSRRFFWISEV